ncbi:MAG: tetratricopeptide repeat protein [Dehalococcoidia bacterium]
MTDDLLRRAQMAFEAGNFRRCRELALQGLMERPEDPRLLSLAGRAGLDLGFDDARSYLRRTVDLLPDDAEAWHALGLTLMQERAIAEAVAAFREAARLRADDPEVLVDLGHGLYALGEVDEAIALLSDAAGQRPADLATMRSLLEMQRETGHLTEALTTARQITAQRPDDLAALVDIADLHLVLHQLDEASAIFGRLRRLDTEPGHDVHAYHGMIQAELRRNDWRRALDLALDATVVSRLDLTTQLLAYIAVQLFGRSEHPAPPLTELEAALKAERNEHHRLHSEALIV